MTPYVITLTFLTMISIMTSSEMVRTVSHSLENKFHFTSLDQNRQGSSLGAKGDFENFRDQEPEEGEGKKESSSSPSKETKASDGIPKKLGFDLSRPPNNCRLNLHLIVSNKESKYFSLYELTASLMRKLYGEAPFFLEVPNAEYRILNALKEHSKEASNFCFPDELASLTFDDPQLQALFYKMLKGTTEAPSLLHYITYDIRAKQGDNRKINLMFADPLLLEVIVNNPSATQAILALRGELLEEMLYQETHRHELKKSTSKNRTQYKQELQQGLESICAHHGLDPAHYKKVFDFSLSKMGTIIYLRDPSGTLRRQRHITTKD